MPYLPPIPPPPSRRPPARTVGSVLAGLVVGSLTIFAISGFVPTGSNGWSTGATRLADGSTRPPAVATPSEVPLGIPAPPPPRSGQYSFLQTQPGTNQPVAYDPCRPISIVINDRKAPPGGAHLVRDALDQVSEITGFVFEIEGNTSEMPDLPRPPHQPDRYGDRWAPVLVVWADESDIPELEGSAGLGGSSFVRAPGTDVDVYVSGVVILHTSVIGDLMGSTRGWLIAEGIVLHELGHLVGLGHVDDPNELMYHDASYQYSFGPGDLTGLAALSAGRCVPRL